MVDKYTLELHEFFKEGSAKGSSVSQANQYFYQFVVGAADKAGVKIGKVGTFRKYYLDQYDVKNSPKINPNTIKLILDHVKESDLLVDDYISHYNYISKKDIEELLDEVYFGTWMEIRYTEASYGEDINKIHLGTSIFYISAENIYGIKRNTYWSGSIRQFNHSFILIEVRCSVERAQDEFVMTNQMGYYIFRKIRIEKTDVPYMVGLSLGVGLSSDLDIDPVVCSRTLWIRRDDIEAKDDSVWKDPVKTKEIFSKYCVYRKKQGENLVLVEGGQDIEHSVTLETLLKAYDVVLRANEGKNNYGDRMTLVGDAIGNINRPPTKSD